MFKADNISCSIFIANMSDSYLLIHLIIRCLVLVLNLSWLIFALQLKEIRNKQMIFLINSSVVGLFHCLKSLGSSLVNSCLFQTNKSICLMSTLFTIYIGYHSGYSLSALAVYRMACVYSINVKKWLKWKLIIPLI
jgi:hypothetical protein